MTPQKPPNRPDHPDKPDKPDKPCKPKKDVFVWVYLRIRREPIPPPDNGGGGQAHMTLEPVPYDYQDIYEGTGDEDFENPIIVKGSGDGSQSVQKTGPKKLQLIVRGDGTVGSNNTFSVQVDGHIGDGDAPIITEFDYNVVSPDATEVTFKKIGREPIPKG